MAVACHVHFPVRFVAVRSSCPLNVSELLDVGGVRIVTFRLVTSPVISDVPPHLSTTSWAVWFMMHSMTSSAISLIPGLNVKVQRPERSTGPRGEQDTVTEIEIPITSIMPIRPGDQEPERLWDNPLCCVTTFAPTFAALLIVRSDWDNHLFLGQAKTTASLVDDSPWTDRPLPQTMHGCHRPRTRSSRSWAPGLDIFGNEKVCHKSHSQIWRVSTAPTCLASNAVCGTSQLSTWQRLPEHLGRPSAVYSRAISSRSFSPRPVSLPQAMWTIVHIEKGR
jgi:hypothetical protein